MAKTIKLEVIGETPKDKKHLEKLLGTDGKIVSTKDHPKIGDYGVTVFNIEFDDQKKADRFEKIVKKLGFMV